MPTPLAKKLEAPRRQEVRRGAQTRPPRPQATDSLSVQASVGESCAPRGRVDRTAAPVPAAANCGRVTTLPALTIDWESSVDPPFTRTDCERSNEASTEERCVRGSVATTQGCGEKGNESVPAGPTPTGPSGVSGLLTHIADDSCDRATPEELPEEDEIFTVTIRLENKWVTALMDTGASRSFIHPELAATLKATTQELRTPYYFAGVAGPTLTATQWIPKVALQVKEWTGHHHFVIAALGHEVILGWDFWLKSCLGWDGDKGRLRLGAQENEKEMNGGPWQNRLNDIAPGPTVTQREAGEQRQGLTWQRGDPAQKNEKRRTFREKERRKARFVVRAEEATAPQEESRAGSQPKDVPATLPDRGGEKQAKQREEANKKSTARQRKEEQPFLLERVNGTPVQTEGEPEVSREEQRVEGQHSVLRSGKLCSITQFRTWLRRGEVDVIYAAKISRGEQRQVGHRIWVASKAPAARPKPSQVMQEAGQPLQEDLANLLDEFADIFQDLPPGGVKNREIKHRIPTVPGQLPSYPKQCYNLSDEHLEELKEQLKDLLGIHSPLAVAYSGARLFRREERRFLAPRDRLPRSEWNNSEGRLPYSTDPRPHQSFGSCEVVFQARLTGWIPSG